MANLTSSINVNVPTEVKDEATSLFNSLGLNMSTAINMFLVKSINSGGIPFDISTSKNYRISNEEKFSVNESVSSYNDNDLIEALKESEDIINGKIKTKWYHNVQELIEDLENEN